MKFFKSSYERCSDEQLMEKVRRGEIPALDELYRRYSKRLLYYFYRMLARDEEKAQDFLQDIFLKIIEKPALFDPGKKFSTWIFSVAHNMCKNEYRRMDVRKIIDTEADLESVAGDTEKLLDAIDSQAFAALLALELDMLDEERKTTFLLRYREEFSIKEIAQVVGCSEGTVKSRLFYTVKKLAEKLKIFDPANTEKKTDIYEYEKIS